MNNNVEERIKILEEQVIRLTKENRAISKIMVEKVKPICDAFYHELEYNLEDEEVAYV